MRVFRQPVTTVGELREALAACDPSTRIRWTTPDDEGDRIPAIVEVDATTLTADIYVEEV